MQNKWLRIWQPKPDPTERLFCFHYSGGGAPVFRNWVAELPEVEVCAVQLPGRQERMAETAFTDMQPLVAALYENLRHELLQRPFSFFGYSVGAWIAFEFSQLLRAEKQPLPQQLFVLADMAPQVETPLPAMGGLSDSDFVKVVNTHYPEAIPDLVLNEPDLLAMLLPVMRSDISVFQGYAYQSRPPFDFPIVAMRGESDPSVHAAGLAAWGEHTTAEFTEKTIKGGHILKRHEEKPMLDFVRGQLARTRVA